MNQFVYDPDLTGLKIIKTKQEQHDMFFYSGHPEFLIPDFSIDCPLQDIWTAYLDYLDLQSEDGEVFDQNGGEVSDRVILNEETGLTKCIYTAYGIELNSGDDIRDIEVEIEG